MSQRPHVVMHNTVSLDGAINGFELDVARHEALAEQLGADARLLGSMTARAGIEFDRAGVPPETQADLVALSDDASDTRPLWVIVDSGGLLEGMLHVYRRSAPCRRLVVLVSQATPAHYLEYLAARDYAHHAVGPGPHVDYAAALALLGERYEVSTVRVDSGGGLSGRLLSAGLVDALSLVVAPRLVGAAGLALFREAGSAWQLERTSESALDEGYVHLRYRLVSSECGMGSEDDAPIVFSDALE